MSSKNPFRKPASSEGMTVVVPPPPPSPPLPAIPQRTPSPPQGREPPPALPPRSPVSGPSLTSAIPTSSSHGIHPGTSSTLTIAEIIDEDLPPPYTPAANVGEETVGLGPLRPFQQPPLIPPSSFHPPPDSRYHSNWPPPSAPGLAPWQTQQQYPQRQNGGGSLLGALVDTVRDIADAVSGAHDERMILSRRANAGAYAVPYSSTGTVYAPPPLPMHEPPPSRSTSTPPRSLSSTVPDDGSPTRTPVPGHPLLRSGHLLVYPRDHLCVKCKNTGYKNYDPSNPCGKCWDKYGKSYTGALTYTPWSPSGNDLRMQRPLPKFLPPHLAGHSPLPPQHPHHSSSISQPHYVHPPESGPSYYVMNPLSPDPTLPVPHAIPVSPGDPRLGGRLCMRCGGAGVRMVILIDMTMCDDCGGTGRIWR